MTYALIGGGNNPDPDLAQVADAKGHYLGYCCDADRWTLQCNDNSSVTLIPGLPVSADSIRSAFNIDYVDNYLFVLSVTNSDKILTVVLVKWSDTYDPSTNDLLTINVVYGDDLSIVSVIHDKMKIYGIISADSGLLQDESFSEMNPKILVCMNDVFVHNKLPLHVSFCSKYKYITNKSLGNVIINFDGDIKCNLIVSLLDDLLLPSAVSNDYVLDSNIKLHQKLNRY